LMREYELTVIYDLSVAESGGPEAAVEQVTSLIEARGGKLLKADHWGRRRMAYPINHEIDGDYVVTRVELEPAAVAPLEAALGINERVYRHLIVRADELPVPAPPREPRQPAAAAAPESAPVTEGASEATPASEPMPATASEAPAAEAPAPEVASPAPVEDASPEPATETPAASAAEPTGDI
jgi:small subunit ribosomal protein S6